MLEHIRAELLAAGPGLLCVGAVAARWGFLHAGRFAAAYRRRVGCPIQGQRALIGSTSA